MAENLDNPGFGNFSIQDTMEMGMGNAELLNDLMGPDSATSNPDDIKDINDTPPPAPFFFSALNFSKNCSGVVIGSSSSSSP